jgi:hypothetical protein
MIRAEYGGCGKSFAREAMKQRNHRVLFVCPTNKLAKKYGSDGITINKFIGIGLAEENRVKCVDHSQHDVIVFDEIFFSSIRKLARIKRFCEENQEKIVIATGDAKQLESIDLITNQHDYDEYYNRCIGLVFPNNIFLRESKRLKDPRQRETLRNFKDDIFNEAIPTLITLKKYFRIVKESNTISNIAYTNRACSDVSARVRKEILRKQTNMRSERFCFAECIRKRRIWSLMTITSLKLPQSKLIA